MKPFRPRAVNVPNKAHSGHQSESHNRKTSFTERFPRPDVTLYVPDVSVGPSVALQCVVMGVVPSEANITWIIGESPEMAGWTESGWTRTNRSAVEYTRAHLNIRSDTWLQTDRVECVVQVDGVRVSKAFHRGDYRSSLFI